MTKIKEWTMFAADAALKGEYEVSDGCVTVRCVYGEKTTQVGGSPPETLARMMLGEMARDPSSAHVPYWKKVGAK
jgi:hypothetical protein